MSEHLRQTLLVRSCLWLSVPVGLGGVVASLAGLVIPSVYAAETVNWAAQGRGQDVVNLALYPALLVVAWRAGRGSLRAFLCWLGLMAYSVYSYLLYAGWVHFGGLFLVYVVTFGLSTYALAWGLAAIEPARLRAAFVPTAPAHGVGTVLATLGGVFALLWLAEIVPPTLDGSVPAALTRAGLPSNPVWVLDIGVVLPAMIIAGLALRRGRALGYLLAAPLLVFGAVMGAAIVGMFVALWDAGEPVAMSPAMMIAAVVTLESVALVRLFKHLDPATRLGDVLRGPVVPEQSEERTSAPTAPTRATVG